MSFVPFYSSWGIMIFVVSAFLWKYIGLWIFLIYITVSIYLVITEVGMQECTHNFGFLVFIITELLTFVSLFTIANFSMAECLWPGVTQISEYGEFPLLGSLLLISSSILVTGFHYNYGLKGCLNYLWVGMVLGFCFMLVQFFEFNESSCYFLDCPYYVAAYSTVGLHFLHVLGGLTVLLVVFFCHRYLEFFYVEMSVWYWHFVDFIWCLVFFVFYYPSAYYWVEISMV
uniref:Cytochrome c oxidase subunit 3 n=1 Tax=Posthodiplostomum centrarchi TaxID=1954244 RepID=A0A6J3YMH7_9TREM|nr:cytochrome c oxidase subunit III [Posthodiplostomum centrarchi]